LIIIVIIDNGQGHEVCGTGVCKGVCCQMSKFVAEGFPVLKEGREVNTLNLIDGAVFIAGLQVGDSIGSSFLKSTGY